MYLIRFTCLVILTFMASATSANEVIRFANEGSSLPISTAVEVDGLLFHSGVIPSPADRDAEAGSFEFWGGTEVQAQSVLAKIEESLQNLGYEMGDVVKMTVFLAGDPETSGRLNFQGFMAAYNRFFGESSDGKLPARSLVEVAGLVAPGMLVEIEVIAAKSN